jgi:hypothetical protein
MAKFNATFCLLNLIDESAFVSQNITSVFTYLTGVITPVVSVFPLGSFLDLVHEELRIRNRTTTIPAAEVRYDFKLIVLNIRMQKKHL